MSFIICLLRALGLHSDPFWGMWGVDRFGTAARRSLCPHLCCGSPGWSAILLPLTLALAVCLVVAGGTVAEMQKISVLSLDFKSLPSSASPLAPRAPAGEERSWLICWSQGGDVAELPMACRPPVRSSAVQSHPSKTSQAQWPQMPARRRRMHSGWRPVLTRCLQSCLRGKALLAGPRVDSPGLT